jgi:hypothetical protein
MITKVSTNILLHSDVIVGMDASQMEESLSEAQWEGEVDHHPFRKTLCGWNSFCHPSYTVRGESRDKQSNGELGSLQTFT